ncbi:hypothetical protein Pmani_011323 [Petrolisthes manimaculis]|uniref:Uncharacterized protein n=1 Tax=Petrolisthes manimaculis TaxID=1843537 RepID=A0AAE1Q2P1_9EUCA|nr:hypothetical protein Pmani_011323 [Petrolisthes manimaculis]
MALALLPNNAMTFTENQHGTAVLEKLKNQRELMRCCDVILHVAGHQFQAHRCVLAACSPYFDSIFKASKTVKEQLTVSSQDPEVFQCLLAYMYTGTVVVDRTNVAELLRLANKLLLAKLKEHCAEYLERYLDSANCLAVRDMATKYNLEALEKTTGTFIQGHLSEVIEGEEVLELSLARLEDFLRCPMWEIDESQTLLLVTRWVHHAPKTRERNLRSLLTWVQWPRLTSQAAIQLIQTHPLYTSSNSLLALFFLLDALNEHSLLPADFLAPFSKLKDKFCQSTDSVVDNERFVNLAISTAIVELQDDPVSSGRSQDSLPVAEDFSTHTGPPLQPTPGVSTEAKDTAGITNLQPRQMITDFLFNSRRGCDSQDERMGAKRECDDRETEQCSQYDMGRLIYGSQELHGNQAGLMYSHGASSSTVVGCHTHVSDDSVGDTTSAEEGKFPESNNQGHFGQLVVRDMSVWHQEPSYGAEESLSSDSGHVYQRQVYDQNFGTKASCSESYDKRMNPSGMFGMRENPHKSKQNFASAMSYYVSTYNPDDDMTASDDQSAQSFYEEKFSSGVNFYSCRLSDIKENPRISTEPTHSHETYPKTYYCANTTIKQEIDCSQADVYYNENSTDTQLSNCPQDMTIQNQLAQTTASCNNREKADDNIEITLPPSEATDRIIDQEPHYNHKFSHEMSRSVDEETLTSGVPRVGIDEGIVADENSPLDCAIEGRGIIALIGGGTMVEMDKSYKPCSLVDTDKMYKMWSLEEDRLYNGLCGLERRNESPSSSHKNPHLGNLGGMPEEQHTDTPRQMKYVSHTFTSPDSVAGQSESTAADTTLPCITQPTSTTSVLDFSHLDTNALDPDDPQPVSQEGGQMEDLDNSRIRQDSGESEASHMCIIGQGTRQDNNITLSNQLRSDNSAIDSQVRASDSSMDTQIKLENMTVSTSHMRSDNISIDGQMRPDYFTVGSQVMKLEGKVNLLENHGIENVDNITSTTRKQEPTKRTSGRVRPADNNIESNKATTTERACELCPETFTQSRKYYLHMRDHFPGPPHRCDTCESSFKRIYHLLDHRAIHQDIRTHKCPHCPFSTRRKFNLTEHLSCHTNIRKYKCKTCGAAFSRLQVLEIHETRHTKERPFLCETCGWSGKTKNALITHVKIHTGEVLRCQVSGCSYSTAKKSHLKEHMQRHSNSRPFVCETCGRNFITNSHLRRHMKLHLPEKPLKCPQCDYSSLRQDRLKAHIQKKHTQRKPLKVVIRKRQSKKKGCDITESHHTAVEESNVIDPHIKSPQGDIFSDLENTNISLQPQLPGTPPPTTLSEYPPSPTYAFPAQAAPDDPLMIVPDMSAVTEGFTPLPQSYEGSYHSPQYHTSPSHFASLSPTHTTLSYPNGHHQEESPLNFAAYMKYD